jgi:hypothetical protein
MSATLQEVLEDRIDGLGNDDDLKRGYCDVVVSSRSDKQQVVRLTLIPAFRERLLQRILVTSTPREILPAMLEKKFASDEFLDSLKPEDETKLAHRAMALLIGPELSKGFLRQKLGLKGRNFS